MDPLTYSPKVAAEMLGISTKALLGVEKKELFTPADVWELRAKLERHPVNVGPTRKQLFLNFKGGTGKTSLSTSYAWRLAEMGCWWTSTPRATPPSAWATRAKISRGRWSTCW
jgi:chromosome partitioning protein